MARKQFCRSHHGRVLFGGGHLGASILSLLQGSDSVGRLFLVIEQQASTLNVGEPKTEMPRCHDRLRNPFIEREARYRNVEHLRR
jgi:hypothetical protein